MQNEPRFVADVHLGRLARMLRMLGFDTAYDAAWTKPQLLKTAVAENRTLLSRNSTLSKNPFVQTLLITTENAPEQLAQVVGHFALQKSMRPFSRCIVCNYPIQPAAKEAVLHLLQPETIRRYESFWQCPNCSRVYWQGSHFDRMMRHIQQLEKGADPG